MSSLRLHLLFFFPPLFLLLSIPSLHIFYSPFLPSTSLPRATARYTQTSAPPATSSPPTKASPSHTAPAAESCTTALSPAKKTHWEASHKQQCAQFVKEINTSPPPTNDLGLPDDVWSLMRDKFHKPQIVPLPRRDPKKGKFKFLGSGNPIMDAMMKGVSGKLVMSFGIPRADGSGAGAGAGAGSKEPKGLDVGCMIALKRMSSSF